ncbi:MAG: dienelactone hydrolase family protein [Alphaproteobacteria bacterium]|nr:dienelactone hydrolase family protein [Alphaproteobacteria bacterium]
MGEKIELKCADGTFSGYLAKPANSAEGPGIIVIQEIFGVNKVVRDIADHLADQGYHALAPDLFWRIEPGIDITDQSQAEWDKAFELFGKFNVDTGVADIQVAIDALRAMPGTVTKKVGTVGYCLGGLLAYLSATRTDADANVSYYGVNIANLLGEAGKISKPILLHVAAKDQFVPPDAQAKVAEALGPNPHATLLTYAGQDHAFARPGGAHYHADAARSANAATLAFFNAHLASTGTPLGTS